MESFAAKIGEWWVTTPPAEMAWIGFGFAAQAMFFMRFVIQWIASERVKRSIVPETFWYFSFAGGFMLFIYAAHKVDPVFMAGQFFGLFVYTRNIWLIWAHKRRQSSQQGLTAAE